MNVMRNVLGGAAAALLALGSTPVLAFTHHPATPAEIQQTDQLNAQSLVNAGAVTADATSNATVNDAPATDSTSSSASDSGANANGSTEATTPDSRAGTNVSAAPAKPAPENTDSSNAGH